MQGIGEWLEIVHQWLSTRYHHEPGGGGADDINNICDCHFGMPVCLPAFFHVAPHTTHVAATQPYKVGGMPLIEAFSLQGVKVLHYR